MNIKEWFQSPSEVQNLREQNITLREMLARKDTEIDFLKRDFITKTETQMTRDKGIINDLSEYMDPLPSEIEPRKAVVSKIAGWFEGELNDYILHLISRFEKEIAHFPLTERETDFYRAGINFGHLLIEWGDGIVGEHRANIHASNEGEGESAFDSSEDEAVENIKNIIK